MICEHAIYTRAELGYQIIAHSKNLSKDELNIIEEHSIHKGMIPATFPFSEATMYYPLSEEKICLETMINGTKKGEIRPNRIYTHTLVIAKKDLRTLNPIQIDKKIASTKPAAPI